MKANVLCSIIAVMAALLCPTWAFAQLGDLPVAELAAPTSSDVFAPVPAPAVLHRVQLAVDGNVPGTVKSRNVAGVLTPVRATISVFQNGLLLTTAPADERGHFQLPGLRPGAYSVIADAGKNMGVFAVEVLPYIGEKGTNISLTAQGGAGAVPPCETALDLVLTSESGQPLQDPMMMDYGYPMMAGGGGGGGGGGFGGLASLAGLAGLAGLGGIGGGGPASPAAP